MSSPRTMANAYRIWAYANPLGWDCTVADIAEATGINVKTVGRTLHSKGWELRVRANASDMLARRFLAQVRADANGGGYLMAEAAQAERDTIRLMGVA